MCGTLSYFVQFGRHSLIAISEGGIESAAISEAPAVLAVGSEKTCMRKCAGRAGEETETKLQGEVPTSKMGNINARTTV